MMIKSWTWLWVAGAALVFFGSALAWLAMLLLRGNRSDVMAMLPLAPEQNVELRAAGEVLLRIEVPRRATDYRQFQFALVEPQTGKITTMTYNPLTASGAVYGTTTMKVPIGRMTATLPGSHIVRVAGMTAGKDYSAYRLMLSRPYLGRMIFQIVGIVTCGVGTLLSLLWGLWLMGLITSGSSPVAPPSAAAPAQTVDLTTWKRSQQQPRNSRRPVFFSLVTSAATIDRRAFG